jgi:DNA-binding transcriptional MerR regulator
MGTYSIKDLERLSGIKAHTIRIWEKRYALIEPTRTSTNIRTYCDSDLKKLLNISILNRNGLKISKISELSPQEIVSLVTKLTEDTTATNSQFESLYISMIDMDENLFEKLLSRAIIQLGFENMFVKILYPFFKKMGVMWQTGTISPAQEHFISNLVRQKLIVAIDSIILNNTPETKTFILYLPENEFHELGLLFMNYILRKRGHYVIYLGAALPINSLISMSKIKPAQYMVTSIVGSMEQNELNDYALELTKEFPDKTIFITGNQAQTLKTTSEQIQLIPTISDFIKKADELSSN